MVELCVTVAYNCCRPLGGGTTFGFSPLHNLPTLRSTIPLQRLYYQKYCPLAGYVGCVRVFRSNLHFPLNILNSHGTAEFTQ